MITDKLVENAIKEIREAFAKQFQLKNPGEVDSFFIYGGCFYFAVALKLIFPEARLYNNIGHIVTNIGDKYYDYQGCGNLGEPVSPNKVKIKNDGEQYEYLYIQVDINDISLNCFRQPEIDKKALETSIMVADNFDLYSYQKQK